MGFGPKNGSGVWWLLLIATGVLVAAVAAATAGAEEDGAVAAAKTAGAMEAEVAGEVDDSHGNDMCDIKCQHWGHNYERKQQCVRECKSREHHHPSHAFCEHKCQHWADAQRRQQCVNSCEHYGFFQLGGGPGAILQVV